MFQEIVHRINDVTDGMNEVDHSVGELAAGGSQVLTSLGVVVKGTTDVRDGAADMTERVEKIVAASQEIANISGEIRNGMTEISSGIDGLFQAIGDISQTGAVNARSIGAIEHLVARFKLSEDEDAVPVLDVDDDRHGIVLEQAHQDHHPQQQA